MHFTYLHPRNIKGLSGPTINADISSKRKFKCDWKISENISFVEVKIMSDNIFYLSVYTNSLSLKFFHYWELSAELLEKLFINLSDDLELKKAVSFHLFNCYDLLSLYYANDKNDLKNAEPYFIKMLDLEPSNYLVKCNLALSMFKNGDFKSAENLIDDAYTQSSNYLLSQLNYAFLSILRKEYKKAYRMYQKFFDHKELTFEPLNVIDFLNNEFENVKDPAYLYGSAIINFIYKDRVLGIKDFKKFLRIADKSKMIDMINRSNYLINESTNKRHEN